MYNQNRFFRLFHVWAASQLKFRIIKMNNKFQLPWSSVLHVLDNANQQTYIDTPRLDTNILVQNESYRKWLFHVKLPDYDENSPIQINTQTGEIIPYDDVSDVIDSTVQSDETNVDDETNIEILTSNENLHIPLNEIFYIDNDDEIAVERLVTSKKNYLFMTAKMSANLLKYKTDHMSIYKPLDNLAAIQKRKEALTIINHNPLFRIVARGNMKLFKKYQLILGSVINTCCKIDNKNHYIQIPFTPEIFVKTMFTRSEKVINNSTVKRQDSFHYCYMLNLMNFLNPFATTSMFSLIPKEKLASINFFMYINDYAVIYNLQDLVDINHNNSAYLRIINQLNTLALIGSREVSNTEFITKITEEQVKIENSELNKPLSDIKNKSDSNIKTKKLDLDYIVDSSKVHADSSDNINTERPVVIKTIPTVDDIAFDNGMELDIDKELEIIRNKKATPINTTTSETVVKSSSIVNSKKVNVTKEENKKQTPVTIPIDKIINDVTITDDSIYTRDIIVPTLQTEIDTESFKLIEDLPNISPKKRERLINISQAYKKITIGDETIESLLNQDSLSPLVDNRLDFLKGQVPDESMLKSSVINFDDVYMKKSFKRDLAATCSVFNKKGFFLVDVEEKNIANELSRDIEYKITFEDINGTKHTSKIKMPKVDENGHCYINGTTKIMKKQMINLPICKISPTRVSLSSNYNKSLVEKNQDKSHRFNAHIEKLVMNNPNFNIAFNNLHLNEPLAYEYTVLARKFKSIEFTDKTDNVRWMLDFDYYNRTKDYNEHTIQKINKIENTHSCVYFGVNLNKKNEMLFINPDNDVFLINLEDEITTVYKHITELIYSGLDEKPSSRLTEWVNVRIQDKKQPVIFVLAYRFGLINTLDYLKVKYTIYDKEEDRRVKLSDTEMMIDFLDKRIVFDRYPYTQSLIVAGLKNYDLSDYKLEQFDPIPAESDGKDVYYDLLMDKNISIHYLKGIDNFFDFFVDPQTRDVLIDMNEPTNFRDLLIRATVMLTTEHAYTASSMKHHRLRSYERFSAIVYNELSRKLADHRFRSSRGSKFTIQPTKIYSRIITDRAMIPVDSINPIQDIKEKSSMTFTGVGGRSSESFVVQDRVFADDALGIISESTPDSGNVAINASLTMNPSILNDKGMLESKDINSLDPTEMLSVTACLMPCATNDDAPRVNFINIQMTHVVPTVSGDVSRIRTGMERVIAHRCSDNFVAKARGDGTVLEINEKAKMVKIQYDDKSIDVYNYGEEQSVINDGICITQNIKCKVRDGDKLKYGDIICYNEGFFQEDPYSTQIDWKHGVNANVALIEHATTVEDSNMVSKSLSMKLGMFPTEMRFVTLSKDSVIHHIIKAGSTVDNTDYLMRFEDGDFSSLGSLNIKDENALAILDKLNQTTPRAKYTGEVVKIEALYSCSISDMSESLAKVVKECGKFKNIKHEFAKDAKQSDYYVQSQPLPQNTKYKGALLDKDSVVLIFYIKQFIPFGTGDKCVFGNQMKSVSCKVTENTMRTSSGVEVDALFSATSLSKRIVNSPLLVGIGNRILEKVETDILRMYYDDEDQ